MLPTVLSIKPRPMVAVSDLPIPLPPGSRRRLRIIAAWRRAFVPRSGGLRQSAGGNFSLIAAIFPAFHRIDANACAPRRFTLTSSAPAVPLEGTLAIELSDPIAKYTLPAMMEMNWWNGKRAVRVTPARRASEGNSLPLPRLRVGLVFGREKSGLERPRRAGQRPVLRECKKGPPRFRDGPFEILGGRTTRRRHRLRSSHRRPRQPQRATGAPQTDQPNPRTRAASSPPLP
jgi:hypothetical protein